MVRLRVTLPELKIHFEIPKLPTHGEVLPLDMDLDLYDGLVESGENFDCVELHTSTNGFFLVGFKYKSLPPPPRYYNKHGSALDAFCCLLECVACLSCLCPEKVKTFRYPVQILSD